MSKQVFSIAHNSISYGIEKHIFQFRVNRFAFIDKLHEIALSTEIDGDITLQICVENGKTFPEYSAFNNKLPLQSIKIKCIYCQK